MAITLLPLQRTELVRAWCWSTTGCRARHQGTWQGGHHYDDDHHRPQGAGQGGQEGYGELAPRAWQADQDRAEQEAEGRDAVEQNEIDNSCFEFVTLVQSWEEDCGSIITFRIFANKGSRKMKWLIVRHRLGFALFISMGKTIENQVWTFLILWVLSPTGPIFALCVTAAKKSPIETLLCIPSQSK